MNDSDSTGLTEAQFIKASVMVYELTHGTKLRIEKSQVEVKSPEENKEKSVDSGLG